MAQYMSAWMGSYDMTPEEKQEYDAYMEELSNRMFLDVYMREIGGNCYMLVQIYSGDQAGNAALLLSQMQPYAGGGWSYTEAGGWQYLHGDGTFGTNEWAWTRTALHTVWTATAKSCTKHGLKKTEDGNMWMNSATW